MASISTSAWAGSSSPQARFNVTVASSTNTTVTYNWSVEYVAKGYAAYTNGVARNFWATIDGTTVVNSYYNINGVSSTVTIASGTHTVNKGTSSRSIQLKVAFYFDVTWSGYYAGSLSATGSITVPAKPSYKVTYNANGGSGAPSQQTKWYGTTLKLSSTKPTRTGYTFQGWGNKASSPTLTWQPGGNYTLNQSSTLYAIWEAVTYSVTYDANGGSGAPAAQTKTYGVNLTLTTSKPTRTNYNFLGWATSANSTTVTYASGAIYSVNAAITLYAVWELAYVSPSVSGLTVDRCNSDGTLNDEGIYARIKFKWSIDGTLPDADPYYQIDYPTGDGFTGMEVYQLTGTLGSIDVVFTSATFDPELTGNLHFTLTDGSEIASTTPYKQTINIPPTFYTMDFLKGGKGVSIGKPAIEEGFRVSIPSTFEGGINPISIPANSDLNDYTTPGFYYCPMNSTAVTLVNSPTGLAFSLEVTKHAGIHQRLVTYRASYLYYVFERNCYNSGWSYWFMVPKGGYSSTSQGYRFTTHDHMALGNGFWVQGELSSGNLTNILRMNESNQVELNWTSGGVTGRMNKLIWSGTAADNASITSADFPYYNLFALLVSNGSTNIINIGYKRRNVQGSIFHFGSTRGLGGNYYETYGMLTYNSDTSYKNESSGWITHNYQYVTSSSVNLTIKEIWGIL